MCTHKIVEMAKELVELAANLPEGGGSHQSVVSLQAW